MDLTERFERNEKLITFVYQKFFSQYSCYYEDLFQEGAGALWSCCINYDEKRNVQFSTYACVSIQRAMKKYICNQVTKHESVISMDNTIYEDCNNKDIKLEECIGSSDNNSVKEMMSECLKKLPQKERRIIYQIFKGYKQREISAKFSISQQTVSKTLIKYKHFIMIENLKSKEETSIMNYAKKQCEDVLTLAYHYAIKNSKEENKVGCYIVSENGWRTVLAKGCKTESQSALRNATQKIKPENSDKANNHTLFITRADIEPKLISRYGIKTIVYGGDPIDDNIKETLEKRDIDIIHISDWKPNASN